MRQTFNDSLQARKWEEKVIKRLNIVELDKWLNKGNTGREFFLNKHSEEWKRERSQKSKGKGNAMYGRKHSEESKRKNRESNLEYYKNHKSVWIGRKHSEESKRKNSEWHKGKVPGNKGKSPQRIICNYCGKEVSIAMYNRWHGDKCKIKPNYTGGHC